MMDIDRVSYIFGSFARRRQGPEICAAKRRSIETSKKTVHDRSKSTPHQSKKFVSTTARAKSVVAASLEETKFKCPMCKKQYADPRVLPCLHTFCLKCLEEMEKRHFTTWYDDDSDARRTDSSGSRKTSSGGSGYASDKHVNSPDKGVRCLTCGSKTEIPPGGISCFPPNYPLQYKMILAAMNSRSTHLLCDLCTPDVPATARCMDCAVNFCDYCGEAHLRQRSLGGHELLSLEQARERGITKVRRQIMCLRHPDLELTFFCSTCLQVICRDCISASHRGHMCELITRAAQSHLTKLRLAADRAKSVVEESTLAASKLEATSKEIDSQCNRVEREVDRFIEEYLKSVEDHKLSLLDQIKKVRQEKLQSICQEKIKLQKKIKDAKDIVYFLDDLLNDGTDVEVLSFLNSIKSKIEKCDNLSQAQDGKLSASLQFLKEEAVKCSNNVYTLYGVITTQGVSPEHCHLDTEGLQNLRLGRRAEIILETRDHDNLPLARGGQRVSAEIRHRDAIDPKDFDLDIQDNRNGTYALSFVPNVAGNFILSISVKGKRIKGSPFSFIVRTIKQHAGTFHCCTFCSSGGCKDATCGCEGKMPGGYKGCGHGHEGHPGKRHWSCCGNVFENSECGRSNSQYQFTL